MRSLYKDRKFKSWTINRVAEALCDEWSDLNPSLIKNNMFYGKKFTQIVFTGEVTVTIILMKERLSNDKMLLVGMSLSLSPELSNLKTHALNTFDIMSFVHMIRKKRINYSTSIQLNQTWEQSELYATSKLIKQVINNLISFDGCYNLLTRNIATINGEHKIYKQDIDVERLNTIKAFSLVYHYKHGEKYDDVIQLIKKRMSHEGIESICSPNMSKNIEWLYTKELRERLCA